MLMKGILVAGVAACCAGSVALAGSAPLLAAAPGASQATEAAAGDTASVRLAISGMTCGSCATTARIALKRVAGVYDARVSYDSASAVVLYDPGKTNPEEFIAYMNKMTGYEARAVEPAEKPGEKS